MPMPDAMPNDSVQTACDTLIAQARTGVLLTVRNGHPFGSHATDVLGEDWSRVYLHLSRLALHTQHLLEDPRVSLFIAEPDGPEKNPSSLQRLNLQGTAAVLPPTHDTYDKVKERYLTKFPRSHMMFGFGDFALWELQMRDAHLVLGFGQAYQSHSASPKDWHHQKPEKKS